MSYIDDMNKLARKKQIKESKAMMQKLVRIYESTFSKLSREWILALKKNGGTSTASTKLKLAYMMQVHSKILDLQQEYGVKASKIYTDLAIDMFGKPSEFEKSKKYDEFYQTANKVADICNEDYLKYMYSGGIYKDGKGLSTRVWEAVARDGAKIENEIMSCIGKGMASKDMHKYLNKFLKQGQASYNCERIARTTYCHMSQMAVQDSAKVNPYVQGIKWHSVHSRGRTCDICLERDGKVYAPKDLPFDHPNGMCYMEQVPMINGKQASAVDVAKDLNKWLKDEPNSGTMDKWYKQSKGAIKKAEKPISKATTKVATKPKAETFKTMLRSEANEWSKKFKDSGVYDKLSNSEKKAIRSYTGSGYQSMNNYLRSDYFQASYDYKDEDKLKEAIKNATEGLSKLKATENIQVHRGSNINAVLGDLMKDNRMLDAYEKALMGDEGANEALTNVMKGIRLTDKGFMSTSINESSTFGGGLNMHINVPKGSNAGGYVNGISKYENSEYEFLMKPGTTVEVTKAWSDDEGNIHVLCDLFEK